MGGFSLVYTETPGADTQNIVIAANVTGGSIGITQPVIMVQKIT